MLGDRHQLHVREANFVQIVPQRMREIAVVEKAAVLAAPRTQVQLVDRHRRIQAIVPGTRGHPFGILPLVLQSPYARRGGRRQLAEHTVRISLLDDVSAEPRGDAILVPLASLRGRHPTLPDAGSVGPRYQRVFSRLPTVPVTDHRHRGGVGGPNGEVRARSRLQHLASKLRVQLRVRTLAEQVDVLIGQHGGAGS